MANCPAGQEDYKGFCVPSTYTPAEKEDAYQQYLRQKSSAKSSINIGLIVFGIAGLVALAALIYTFS
jgi:Na+/proline symporter